MVGQNILQYYGQKLDLKLDSSETYDFVLDSSSWVDLTLVLDYSETYDIVLDTTGWVDLVLDYSELYDFQLDNSIEIIEYDIPILYSAKDFGCDYTILTQDEFSILTQNEECLQYQH